MSTKSVPTIQTVVRSLTDWLGPALVGEMCGMQGAAPLKKWQVKPPNVEEEGKLRTGYEAFQIIRKAEGVDIARAWMLGMNPHLENHSGADGGSTGRDGNPIIETGLGYGRDVLAAARAYIQDPMSN